MQIPLGNIPNWLFSYLVAIHCVLIGALGGLLYGLRAIYVNFSAKNNWVSTWELWYYLRPIVSGMCGFVSYIFLSAGIVVLEANPAEGSSNYGFLAFAFIAGFNVDRFLRRVEDIAQSTFGVDKSRSATDDD